MNIVKIQTVSDVSDPSDNMGDSEVGNVLLQRKYFDTALPYRYSDGCERVLW